MTRDTQNLREITINGRPTATDAETLADLVAEQGFATVRVATARNGDFVAERQRTGEKLHTGDRIEILSVRQGG